MMGGKTFHPPSAWGPFSPSLLYPVTRNLLGKLFLRKSLTEVVETDSHQALSLRHPTRSPLVLSSCQPFTAAIAVVFFPVRSFRGFSCFPCPDRRLESGWQNAPIFRSPCREPTTPKTLLGGWKWLCSTENHFAHPFGLAAAPPSHFSVAIPG